MSHYRNDFVDTPERQCKGKRGYPSKTKAKRAARRRNLPPSIHAYRCAHCSLFHLGHRR